MNPNYCLFFHWNAMLNNNKTTLAASTHWRVTAAVLGWFALLTRHYSLHRPEHVGMFAGSLLQRGDWDH
jgi:hypothetical protein